MPIQISWRCAECKGTSLMDDGDGNMVCTNCGLVAAERIFQEGEDKRFYADDDEDTRQTETVKHADVLIGADSTVVANDGSLMASRLAQAQRGVSTVDKALVQCRECMRSVEGKRDGLQHVRLTALEFCKKYLESPTTSKGRKIMPLSMAALLTAARAARLPVQLKELCDWTGLEQKDLNRYMTNLQVVLQKLGIEVVNDGNFTEFYATKLEMPPKWLRLLPKAYERLKVLNPNIQRDTAVVSAALVYESIKRYSLKSTEGLEITLRDIGMVSNKSTELILRCHKQDVTPYLADLWRNEPL